jgi:hypothetical protein
VAREATPVLWTKEDVDIGWRVLLRFHGRSAAWLSSQCETIRADRVDADIMHFATQLNGSPVICVRAPRERHDLMRDYVWFFHFGDPDRAAGV